jgi:hypothetical protein
MEAHLKNPYLGIRRRYFQINLYNLGCVSIGDLIIWLYIFGFIIIGEIYNKNKVEMKVIKYSEFTKANVTDEEYFRIVEGLEAHYNDMLHKGESVDQINEGLWDLISGLGGKLMGGFEDRLKNYAAGWLLDKLGLPNDGGFMSEFAKNIVENISFMHIGSYFGAGSCKYWTQAISKGLLETIEEKAISAILSRGLGININFESGLGGTFVASTREALTNYINSTAFVNMLESKLEGVVCGEGTSFKSIFGGGKFSEKDLAKAAKTSTDTPDNTAGSGGGILSLLGLGQ